MGEEGILEVGNYSSYFQYEDHKEILPWTETGRKVIMLTLTWPDSGSRKSGKKLRDVRGGNLGGGGKLAQKSTTNLQWLPSK